jgi:hypothetical protein
MTWYPDAPGHRGIGTSVEAADLIAPFSSRLRQLVYRTLWEHPGGLTVDELCAMVGYPRYSLQPRFTELKHASLIRDTGRRRFNQSGARAIVWATVAEREDAA